MLSCASWTAPSLPLISSGMRTHQRQLEELTLGSSRMICGGIWAEHCPADGKGPSYWLIGDETASTPSNPSGYEQCEHSYPAAEMLRAAAFQAELAIALLNRPQYVRDLLNPII